jgi:hypothetical protein
MGIAKKLRKYRERGMFSRSLLLLHASPRRSNILKKVRAGVHTAKVKKWYHDVFYVIYRYCRSEVLLRWIICMCLL